MTVIYVEPPEETPAEVRHMTQRFFAWEDGGERLAIGGEMSPSLLGDTYLWLKLLREDLTAGQALRGMREVSQYLRGLPGTVLAECVKSGKREARFLLACGFLPAVEGSDRNLYIWSGKLWQR